MPGVGCCRRLAPLSEQHSHSVSCSVFFPSRFSIFSGQPSKGLLSVPVFLRLSPWTQDMGNRGSAVLGPGFLTVALSELSDFSRNPENCPKPFKGPLPVLGEPKPVQVTQDPENHRTPFTF